MGKYETAEAWALGGVGAAIGVYDQFLKPNPGVMAWSGLVAGVASYDIHAIKHNQQTMSQAFYQGVEHPVFRFMCLGALGATALHLTKVIPKNLDVYYLFGHNDKP